MISFPHRNVGMHIAEYLLLAETILSISETILRIILKVASRTSAVQLQYKYIQIRIQHIHNHRYKMISKSIQKSQSAQLFVEG